MSRIATVAGVATLVVLATGAFSLVRGTALLQYSIGDECGMAQVGELISAPGDVPLEFSDGTRLVSRSGARLRVTRVRGTGADIRIEEGRVSFDVVPRRGNDWEVAAGPFVVLTAGSRFDVEWHESTDTFVLEVFDGDVELAGCASREALAVHAGERVSASCSRGTQNISKK